MPSTAWAYWNSEGTGTGTATVATLPPTVVTAVSPLYSDEVEVSWEEPAIPAGMAITGYRVVRVAGGTPSPACGTSPALPLPPTTLSCVDSGLADGDADYVVTAVVGTWTTSGTTEEPVTVAADRTAPTIRLSGAQRTNALIDRRDGQTLLFFRPAAGGSIRIDAELTDEETGPQSATFPAVSAAGWSHASETVTTGMGAPPSVTYRSTALTFAPGAATPAAMAVTGVDERGNAGTRRPDPRAGCDSPSGGAATVNGVAADVSGSQSWDTDGSFTVSAITPFVEAESASASGLDDVVLTRESAALADGACSAFGGASDIGLTAPVQETSLPDGCYRYTLSGVDRIGNATSISTTVRVDATAPTGGALQANGVDAVPAGSTSISASGSWSVARTDFADAGSGMVSSTLTRAQSALSAGACQTYGAASTVIDSPGQVGASTGCYRYVLTGINAAGLSSELSTTVWVDRAVPTGGAVTVNGQSASAAGTTSTRAASDVTVSSVVGFTDAESGMASSTLVRTFAPMVAGVCGTFDPASAETVPGAGVISGLPDGCHRFTLTGTDLAGNSASISTTVRLDASAPADGAITINAVSGTAAGAEAGSTVNNWSVGWTKFTDTESIINTATLVRTQNTLTGGVCSGTWTSSATVTTTGASGTAAQTGMTAGRCYRYVLTGTNALGLTSTLTLIVRYDSSAPTGGVLVVNGRTLTNATPVTTTNVTGTFTVAVSPLFSDTVSGMASNVLTRAEAPVAANVCGTFGPPVITTLTATYSATESGLAPGCYQYVLTGTNGAGGLATRTTTVRVDSTPPVGALTVNGVAAASTATASQAIAAYLIVRTDFTDPETTMTSSTLVRTSAALTGGVCGTSFTGATTITVATTTQSGLASACYRYVLTGLNALGLSAAVSTIVAYDPSPSGGAFTVNTTAASAAGSTLNLATGANFSISAFTGYTETQSLLVSSTFTRTTGVSTGGVCGGFDSATTVTLPSSNQTQNALPNGCYRYVLTGVNSFGGTASVSSTVRVGP